MRVLKPVSDAGIAGAPMNYDWNFEVMRAIRHPLDGEHPRLVRALSMIDPAAAFGVLLATAEWVAWRFEGIVDVSDALDRIEAGYAALADARYASLPEPDEPFPDTLQDAHGPLLLARMLITTGFDFYRQGDPIVKAVTLSMVLLARHVCPKRAAFERWLATVLRGCHRAFPDPGAPADEPRLLPREFFEMPVPWDPAGAKALLAQFLAALDPAANRYLRDEPELRSLGFQGPAYRLP